MSFFDETPKPPQEPGPNAENSTPQQELSPAPPALPEIFSSLAAEQVPPLLPGQPGYPEDLTITWSWPHFIVFLVFIFASLVTVNGVCYALYAPHQKMTTAQLEQYMLSKPQVAVGGTVAVFALLLFFLYFSLALLRGQPFWSTLGWRKMLPKSDGRPRHPLIYFFSGCGLSLLVMGVTAIVKPPENTPIEEMFKFKQTAMLFMATAVFLAPLAEETIFRGYLYPMFARWFGVLPSIVVTGVLFGLMHGPQLGGTLGMIAVMSFVGITFTVVRARTGSVFASYLMHFGYNSLIGVISILVTHGFTQVPTTH